MAVPGVAACHVILCVCACRLSMTSAPGLCAGSTRSLLYAADAHPLDISAHPDVGFLHFEMALEINIDSSTGDPSARLSQLNILTHP